MSDFDDRPTVDAISTSPLGGTPGNTDCLIVIYTKGPTLLGKKFVLNDNPTRVGRSTENHIVLDGDSVSRRHAQFVQRGPLWLIVDESSTNGTYCNDEPIVREMVLKNGDRVKIGPTIFKFLSGAQVETQYHEEIFRMTIIDGLTQIYNQRFLYKELERKMTLSRRHERDLAILVFDVDHLKRINDMHGPTVGDLVLRELARIVQMRVQRDELFARINGDRFCIIVPEGGFEAALTLAEALREQVHMSDFPFQTGKINVTISIGAALLSGHDRNANDLVMRACEALYRAKTMGRNRVVPDPSKAARDSTECPGRFDYRPVFDGPTLIQRVVARGRPVSLLAFEVDEEAAIVELLGSRVYEEWFHHLVQDADTAIGKDDALGIWHNRYVLTVLQDGTPETAARISDAVQHIWMRRSIAEGHRVVPRLLRSARLSVEEFSAHGERALDMLVGRLLQRRPNPSMPEDDLPFPIAALKPMASTRRTALGRVRSLLEGIETALRFTVAIELAAIHTFGDAALCTRVAELLVTHVDRGDPWETSALDLAVLVPTTRIPSIDAMIKRIGTGHGQQDLANDVQHAAKLRTAITRQIGISEDAHHNEEAGLLRLLDTIIDMLRPLSKMSLMSVAAIDEFDDEDSVVYGLYLHRGCGEHFPIIRKRLPHRLQKGACYLLAKDRACAPLSLAPIVFSRTCESCGRVEIAIAESLMLGPREAVVKVHGVTTHHEGLVSIHWQESMQLLFDAIAGIRARENNRPIQTLVDIKLADSLDVSPSTSSQRDVSTARPPPAGKPQSLVILLNAKDRSDEAMRDELVKHLAPSQRTGAFTLWHEGDIRAGQEREPILEGKIDQADYIVILLTPDFLADTSLVELTCRATDKGKCIVPALARDCLWDQSPWAKLTPLPTNRVPVRRWADRDAAWNDIAAGLVALLAADRS